MKGVVLGINLHDYKSQLSVGDLVCNEGVFYKLESIDPRYLKEEKDLNNPAMYFVKSKINNELMNFERKELSKACIGIFDSSEYFNNGRKIKLGNISQEDLRNIKSKALLEWDLPFSDLDNIHDADIIDLEFDGKVLEKEIYNYENMPTLVKYFKLN